MSSSGTRNSSRRVLSSIIAVAALAAAGIAEAFPVTEATLPMGSNTAGIQVDPVLGHVYVTNFDDGTGTVVDAKSLTVMDTVPLGPHPRRFVDDAARHSVYIVLSNTPGSLFIGTWGEDTDVSIAVGNNPRTIGSDFMLGRVYVSNFDSNSVSVIDTSTKTVIATLPTGAGPVTPVSNSILKKVYIPNQTDGTVTVINETTLTVIKTIPVGKGPQYGAIDAQHGKVYVNNVTDKTISVIDSNTDTVIKTLPSGSGLVNNFGTVSPVYRRYYLPNATDGTLTIVNTDSDTVVNTLTVGGAPYEALVDAVGGDVYVVNHNSDSVSVINAATETVIGSFTVGGEPWRMAQGLGHLFILNTNGTSAADSMTVTTLNNSIANTAIATEFYHQDFNHYFNTADETETRVLLDGLFHDAWHRTFQFYRVWTTPGPDRFPVSRFFSTQWGTKSSHFFTAIKAERDALVAGTIPGWQLEADGVYYIGLADANGNCPPGQAPLFRLYNDGQGGAPNHRLIGDMATRDMMVATQGWVSEGWGPLKVYGCIPTLLAG